MNTKHTPAPWLRTGNTVYALMHNGWCKGVETFRNRFSVSIQSDRECDASEAEANARLIAAAPELLEALKLIASFESRVKGDQADIAKKAIAKATGEQA